MSTFKKIAFALVAVVACCSNTHADDYHHGFGYGKHYGLNFHVGGHPLYHGVHGYYWNHHRGYPYWYNGHEVADVIRSSAQANLLNAHARTQNEVARSANLDNNVKKLNTHLERRRINSVARFSRLWEQGAIARAEKAAAEKDVHMTSTTVENTDRLSRGEVNALSGRLDWPLLLQMEHYTRARGPVNTVFADRAKAGKINADVYLPLCKWVEKISAELDKNVHNYPEADYAEAKDFLRRLVVEARLPAHASGSMMQLASK